ncbi:glycosyltransferase family 4 protein [bacterium]|nr:glycosyltransferase family 4 protein [bacterium]
MRIVEMLASRHFTGPAERVLQTATGLAERGHDVAIAHTVVPPGTLAAHGERVGIKRLPDVALRRKGIAVFKVVSDARHLARRAASGDGRLILHTHTSHDHWTALLAKRRAGGRIAIVRTVHETRQARRRAFDAPLFAACDGVIAITEAMRTELTASYRLSPDRVAVIPGAVDTDLYRSGLDTGEILREIGAGEEPVIGIVSRIKGGRGHDVLLRAFRQALDTGMNARLAIVGRGEGREAIESLARELGLGERTAFLGYRRDDLPRIYNAMTVKVLLGEGSDGTCRAALEAMACGVPVIAAPVGALPEIVRDGETGTLLARLDTSELARALAWYAEHREEAAVRGRFARTHVETHHAIAALVDRHESFLERIMGGGGA